MRWAIGLLLLATVVCAGAQEGAPAEGARSAMVLGLAAFKAGHYEEATRDFQTAVDVDPSWRMAHLYLGAALSYQVVPNLDTPQNVAVADRALAQFNGVLDSDPQNLDALRQVASIERNIKRFEEAIATERRIVTIDPNDADAHYSIGVMEWSRAYGFANQVLKDGSLQDDGNGNARLSAAGCESLIANNASLVDDAIRELTRAIEIRPTYEDAMEYMNLAYRKKADVDCLDKERQKHDLDLANEWVRRAVEAKAHRLKEQSTGQNSGAVRQ